MNDQRADIYSRITNQIIAAIEAGTGEFRMPWLGHVASVLFGCSVRFTREA
jgi:antirestriction protein ArdC